MRSRIPTLLHNIYDQSTSLSLYRLPVAPSERATKETTHQTHDPSQFRDSLTLPRSLHRGTVVRGPAFGNGCGNSRVHREE